MILKMNNKGRLHTIAIVMLGMFAASCGGDTTLLSPYNPDDNGPFTYAIKGLRDTSLERTADVRYSILVEKATGKSEAVVLSADDLPKGMEVVYEPVNGDLASYNTTLIIKALRVKEGVHKINIKGASATSGISNNYIKVTVLPYTNPAVGLIGGFMETGQCSRVGALNDNVNIVIDETIKNRIHIKGLFSGVMTNEVYADINPANGTLTIPTQVQNQLTYNGDGTYDDDKLVINYTVTGITINESCTSTLTRIE